MSCKDEPVASSGDAETAWTETELDGQRTVSASLSLWKALWWCWLCNACVDALFKLGVLFGMRILECAASAKIKRDWQSRGHRKT